MPPVSGMSSQLLTCHISLVSRKPKAESKELELPVKIELRLYLAPGRMANKNGRGERKAHKRR